MWLTVIGLRHPATRGSIPDPARFTAMITSAAIIVLTVLAITAAVANVVCADGRSFHRRRPPTTSTPTSWRPPTGSPL